MAFYVNSSTVFRSYSIMSYYGQFGLKFGQQQTYRYLKLSADNFRVIIIYTLHFLAGFGEVSLRTRHFSRNIVMTFTQNLLRHPLWQVCVALTWSVAITSRLLHVINARMLALSSSCLSCFVFVCLVVLGALWRRVRAGSSLQLRRSLAWNLNWKWSGVYRSRVQDIMYTSTQSFSQVRLFMATFLFCF